MSPIPEAARGRLRHVADGRARGSLESVAGTTGLVLAGFDAMTEVMGCVVIHLGFATAMCGYWAQGLRTTSRTVLSSTDRLGLVPGGRAVDHAWSTALDRLLAEARSVGADGVVGIVPTRRRLPGSSGDEEFVLLGTAVRARCATRPTAPFATDLSGDRVAVLLRSGWVPAGFSIRVSQGIRHDDWATGSALARWSANTEVVGLTDLVARTRDDARRGLTDRMAALGAEAVVISAISLRTWRQEPGEGHTDHLAEVTVSGTGLVCFDNTALGRARAPLTIMPLSGNAGERRGGARR